MESSTNHEVGRFMPRCDVQSKLIDFDRGTQEMYLFKELKTDIPTDKKFVYSNTIRRSPRLHHQLSSPGKRSPDNKENYLNRSFENSVIGAKNKNELHTSSRCIQRMEKEKCILTLFKKKEINLLNEYKNSSEKPTDKQSNKKAISENCYQSPHKEKNKTDISISTKMFYKKCSEIKCTNTSLLSSPFKRQSPKVLATKTSPRSKRNSNNFSSLHINKGVHHKIRRAHRSSHIIGTSRLPPVNIDLLLSRIQNEKLRKFITNQQQEKAQIEEVHNIFRNAVDPIKMAHPLSILDNNNVSNAIYSSSSDDVLMDSDFSDIEREVSCVDTDFEEPIIPYIKHTNISIDEVVTKRKFFKSGHKSNTKMEIKITDNIRASVCNGKISLVQQTNKQSKIKDRSKDTNEFLVAQAAVDDILRTLDNLENTTASSEKLQQMNSNIKETEYNTADIHEYFRSRLPYNTKDPKLIEQQFLLLDFLISNNLCNEENFKIFITDPERNKDKAAQVLNELVIVVSDTQNTFSQRIPFKTNDPDLIAQQELYLEFLIKNNICTEENFNIFIANYAQRQEEAASIMALTDNHLPQFTFTQIQNENMNHSKLDAPKYFDIFSQKLKPLKKKPSKRYNTKMWKGGKGKNQYQIDAGQKDFGAQQCRQCGLFYTAHEQEEEQLHYEYHNSLHILRFKGWIDEDIVAVYPEWANDGRIIRITETSPYKRKERLFEIIKLIDIEMGYSSNFMPKTFMAYFAIRKNQIVGLCLTEPLDKAKKYICINGIDYCSDEEHDVKCGVLTIWVSPLNRRMHIATKLIQAVQLNTILGENITATQIAFSTPSDEGVLFAQSLTKNENFFVYQ